MLPLPFLFSEGRPTLMPQSQPVWIFGSRNKLDWIGRSGVGSCDTTLKGHSPLKFGRSFFRRGGWQRGKALKACAVLRYSCGDQIVCSPRQIHTLRFKVMQSWRSRGEYLDIYPLSSISANRCSPKSSSRSSISTSVEPVGTLLSDRRCRPGSTDVSSNKMLFDSYDSHGPFSFITR
jgi:hypothetical protein